MIRPRIFVFVLACAAVAGIAFPVPGYADSLKVAPLTYQDNLNGENKKGFVEISNPSAGKVTVAIEVQAFKQVNDKGELAFYDDPLIAAGVTPDLRSFELGPREAVRMYFGLNGQVLPKKQIFAALFARTTDAAAKRPGVTTSARVGTLLILNNGNNEVRNGNIVGIDVPMLQLGEGIHGSITYKNTGSGPEASGYFPLFAISADPKGPRMQQKGKLLFPGIQRVTDFEIKGSYLGVYQLKVVADRNSAIQNIIVVTGYWRWLLPLVLACLVIFGFFAVKITRKKHKKYRTLHGSRL